MGTLQKKYLTTIYDIYFDYDKVSGITAWKRYFHAAVSGTFFVWSERIIRCRHGTYEERMVAICG